MGNRKRIIQVLKDQIALCGSDQEKERTWQTERTWVTFTADDARRILKMLKKRKKRKKPEGTLGIIQTADSLTFTAAGDAKKGEDRGIMLGKAYMRERIEKELLYRGLLTPEIREVIQSIPVDSISANEERRLV